MKKPPRDLTEEERALWDELTRGAKKLPPKIKKETIATPPLRRPPKLPPVSLQKDERNIPAPDTLPPLRTGRLTALDGSLAERFRKGELPIEATLDLHGHTRAGAEAILQRFIERAYASGRRMLLIITGKGREAGKPGVLQEMVRQALGEGELRPYVLAFTHAQRKDGGCGAFYVLLKRVRHPVA